MTGSQQVSVDLIHLATTCEMSSHAASQLRTGLRKAAAQIQQGIQLGTNSPSGELDAARRALGEALRVHAYNAGNQIAIADHLAAALRIILDQYKSTDELARLDGLRMAAIFVEALPPKPVASHWVES